MELDSHASTILILRAWPKKNEVIPALCDSFGFARFEGGHNVLD
jgi:hypothetical protein